MWNGTHNEARRADYDQSEAKPYSGTLDKDSFWVGRAGTPESYQTICQGPIDHDQADLCQQWRSAQKAEEIAGYTLVGLLISVAGLVGLGITVYLSGQATRAATAQVKLSRIAMETTQRAMVVSSGTKIDAVILKPDGIGGEYVHQWLFTPVWQNDGETPTKMAHASTAWSIGMGPIDEGTFDFATPIEPKRVLIARGGHIETIGREINSDILLEAKEGKSKSYMWGWIEYGDVFEGTLRHRTEFSFEVTPVGDPRSKDCKFRLRMLDRFNGTDEECVRQPKPYPEHG